MNGWHFGISQKLGRLFEFNKIYLMVGYRSRTIAILEFTF